MNTVARGSPAFTWRRARAHRPSLLTVPGTAPCVRQYASHAPSSTAKHTSATRAARPKSSAGTARSGAGGASHGARRAASRASGARSAGAGGA